MPTYLEGNRIDSEPSLLFDKVDTSCVHPQVYWGLRQFGPYDKGLSKVRMVLICPEAHKQQVDALIRELNVGTPIFPGGMPQFFRCNIEIVGEYITESLDVDEYEKKADELVATEDPRKVDTVLAYVPKTSRYFARTPYYRLKAMLASHGFTSQMITESTFENLRWSYLNLASAIFSKAGGIPWVLESEMKNTDMILGLSISNCVSYKHRAGELPQFVGYVNVFDSYGRWMFFEGTAKLYEKEQKAERLHELLSSAITKFEAEKGQAPRSIVIHCYKKFAREEIDGVKRFLDERVKDYNVAFVSIDDSHPFRMYDLKVDDGSFPRGYYVYWNENEVLLSTTGYTDIAGRRMGTPKLLHIRSEQHPVKFLDADDLALQVLGLTKLDWATATPLVRQPITLQFSQELAYLTAAISAQEWQGMTSPEVNEILNRRPWFI
jgi:argonaute-like protein implicated in RNA metabolism and viral defense